MQRLRRKVSIVIVAHGLSWHLRRVGHVARRALAVAPSWRRADRRPWQTSRPRAAAGAAGGWIDPRAQAPGGASTPTAAGRAAGGQSLSARPFHRCQEGSIDRRLCRSRPQVQTLRRGRRASRLGRGRRKACVGTTQAWRRWRQSAQGATRQAQPATAVARQGRAQARPPRRSARLGGRQPATRADRGTTAPRRPQVQRAEWRCRRHSVARGPRGRQQRRAPCGQGRAGMGRTVCVAAPRAQDLCEHVRSFP